MEMIYANNKGYKYIMTVINSFTKFAFTKPLKSKTAEVVKSHFENKLDETFSNR